MKYPNIVQSLINIASYLDSKGQIKMADAIDQTIRIIAEKESEVNYLGKKPGCCEVCDKPCEGQHCPECEEKRKNMTKEQLEKYVDKDSNQNKVN